MKTDQIYGPDKEGNERIREKIMKVCPIKEKKYVKVFANGVFEICVPVKEEDIPPNELVFLQGNPTTEQDK